MNSVSPQARSSFVNKRDTVLKKVSPGPLVTIQVLLEANGALWEGQVETIDSRKATIVLEGYPMVTLSHDLQLRMVGNGTTLEFQGTVCNVNQMVNGNGWFGSGARVDLLFKDIDERKNSQLQLSLRRLSQKPGIAYLYVHALSRNTGDSLLEVRHSNCASDHPKIIPMTEISRPGRSHVSKALNHHVPPPVETSAKKDDGEFANAVDLAITSTQIEIKNSLGQQISAFYDCPQDSLPPCSPVVVISPGYGETKREYINLAYYLAVNGFHVLRYDHTNHVGDSDGDHVMTTLSSMMSDQRAMIEFVSKKWPESPQMLVASSLAGRVAIKTVSQYQRLSALVVLVGIMDVQGSLATVHQEDLLAAYQQGDRPGFANILGLNVSDQFLKDVTENDFATLASTLRDSEKITTPVTFFSAEHDAWVQAESVNAVYSSFRSNQSNWYVIPEALHRLPENPRKAKSVYRQVVASCQKSFGLESARRAIIQPSRRQIGRQNRVEKEAANHRNAPVSQVSSEFWQDYLDHFNSISKCPDYLRLLDHVSRHLGPFHSGQRILDAGCGNGDFGLFFLVNQLHLLTLGKISQGEPIHYVAVDLILGALKRAETNLTRTVDNVLAQFPTLSTSQIPINYSLAEGNLNNPLPFRDNQFDRITCNLVIGYLEDQLFTMRELFRVLAPNGKMVITNLKPEGDFSPIYQNLVESAKKYDELKEARELLNNYGKIRRAEKDGVFQFFGRQQWNNVLASIGAIHTQIYPTFANQAYLVVIEKPSIRTSQLKPKCDSLPMVQHSKQEQYGLGLVA